MKRAYVLTSCLIALSVYGCTAESTSTTPPPAPHRISFEARGHYCGMSLEEHEGPKAQALLRSQEQPIWFTAINQAVAFTLLPEEPKDIAIIYVHDMGTAQNWAYPEHDSWINAHEAHFVIESTFVGGMGASDAVPFGTAAQAEAFAQQHGGRVVAFEAIPEALVLGSPAPRRHTPRLEHE